MPEDPAAPAADLAAALAEVPARPRYARLSEATWARILKEYLGGASAPQLADKWGVCEATVRSRILKHNATKISHGDASANRRAEVITEADQTRRLKMELSRARLFADFHEDDVVEPSTLALLATVASGRAMLNQLWPEARILAHLADVYARLNERKAVEITLEDLLGTSDRARDYAAERAAADTAEAALQSP